MTAMYLAYDYVRGGFDLRFGEIAGEVDRAESKEPIALIRNKAGSAILGVTSYEDIGGMHLLGDDLLGQISDGTFPLTGEVTEIGPVCVQQTSEWITLRFGRELRDKTPLIRRDSLADGAVRVTLVGDILRIKSGYPAVATIKMRPEAIGAELPFRSITFRYEDFK